MVVELLESGKSTKKISEDLVVKIDYLCCCYREYKASKGGVFLGNGNRNLSESEKKILALKKELRDTQLKKMKKIPSTKY